MHFEKENNKAWWQPAIMMFGRLSAWIFAPVVMAVFIGKWLDQKYGTEPWMFIGCTAVAFIISMIGLIKNVKEEYRKIDKNFKK